MYIQDSMLYFLAKGNITIGDLVDERWIWIEDHHMKVLNRLD